MSVNIGKRRVHSQSPTAQAWLRFRRHPLALAGLILFALVLLATLAAPLIARYGYAALNLSEKFQSPSLAHFLGTDRVGRDIWSRTLYGGRVSLAVGFAAASISTVIGVILGSVSGFYRGKADQIILRFTDVVMTFPRVVIILTAAIYLGQSIASVIFLDWNLQLARSHSLGAGTSTFTEGTAVCAGFALIGLRQPAYYRHPCASKRNCPLARLSDFRGQRSHTS